MFEKLKDKKFFNHKYPIFVNSIPKCGTNLMMNLVNAIPGIEYVNDYSMCHTYEDPEEAFEKLVKPEKKIVKGGLYVGHVPYSDSFNNWLKENNVKQIFVIRDPRDFIVSLSHYVTRDTEKKHAYYDLYMDIAKSHQDRFQYLIEGFGEGVGKFITSSESIPNIKIVFGAYEKWLKNENSLTVPFEKVINPEVSQETMMQILSFLDLKSSYTVKRSSGILAEGTDSSRSRTFRKGEIGGWKKSFNSSIEKTFNDFVGNSLNDFMVNNKL